MAMENEAFEDVFPIEHVDFPASYVGLPVRTLKSNSWPSSIQKFMDVSGISVGC